MHGCVCTAHRSDPRGLLWGRQIKRLHAEKEELEQQVEMLQARCRKIEEEASEQRALDEKKHADEVRACDVHALARLPVAVSDILAIVCSVCVRWDT